MCYIYVGGFDFLLEYLKVKVFDVHLFEVYDIMVVIITMWYDNIMGQIDACLWGGKKDVKRPYLCSDIFFNWYACTLHLQ